MAFVRFRSFPTTPLAAAALLALAGAAHAQEAAQTVQVTGRNLDTSDVTGFGTPLARTPLQATTIDASALADIGANSLSDLARLDASLTDAYNSVGYWTAFSIRGFQVDPQRNFLRDGLPINAETVLQLDNKSRVDILKGLSGMQAGTSAPGGLVNLVVKRPDGDLRDASIRWSQPGTVGTAVDLSQRFGPDRTFGARLNASVERLDPNVRDAKGHRHVLALATDWRITHDSLLEFEIEHNLQSEPSVQAMSLLGDTVPDPHAISPRLNLNDQPWSLPVVTQGNTMSLRFTQTLPGQWKLKVQAMQQKLVSNDHLAFAYGYADCDTCDRFASDGSFSIYDFRSDGERRQQRVGDVSLSGDLATGPLRHTLTLGAQASHFTARFNDEAYNYAGEGSIDGQTLVPANPTADIPQSDRTERSTELYLRDTIAIGDAWNVWLGLRHTRLDRVSFPTSGDQSGATPYRQSFTTPWLSLSRQITPEDMAYVSWGEGVETSVTPNQPEVYVHPGQVQPATTSRQWEAGWKHARGRDSWGLTVYDLRRPQYDDADDGNGDGLQDHVRDGNVVSRGVEAEAQTRVDALTLRASAMWQRVRREGTTENDGLRPTNVPDKAVKLGAAWDVAALPGLALRGDLGYEGGREVLPDNSARIPGWTRVDLGLRYAQPLQGMRLTWRAGVDNAFDRRAWRESPYQYGHAYLFALEARTFFASLDASF